MEAPNVIVMIIARVAILFYSNVKDKKRRGLGSRGGQENDVGRPGLSLQ